MVKNRQLIVVILAVTIGALLFVPFSSAISDGTGVQTQQNESFTTELDTTIDLDYANIQNGTETIEYNDSGTYTTIDSSNYSIDYDAGTINISSSSSVPSGVDARATYDYRITDQQTTTVLQLSPLLLALLLLVTMASRIMKMM